jgi:hypothetical protein
VDRYRDVVAEGKIVHHVDGEEHDRIDEPDRQWHRSGLQEEGRVRAREVLWQGEQCHQQELGKRDQEA